mmetsp:Transcript_34745/g.102120  ORF Transcript_34745/g.102120 Transcript_34745/m.102120 type:complete len:417 (-) Transcript_34745:37-1287(-)
MLASTTGATRALAARRLVSSSVLANSATGTNNQLPLTAHSLIRRTTAAYSTSAPALYSFDRNTGSPFSMNSGSSSSSGGGGDGTGAFEVSRWPLTKANTVLNIVPQGKRFIVERFGKLSAIHDSGYFIAIPFVDHIAYVIDVRERAIDIPPQSAITRDNVSVEVSGNLFVRFVDAEKAAYGARNPLYSVMQHAQSAMRSAIGEMELDEILHGRARLNSLIKGSLQEAAVPWGLEVRRYEITEITPDEQIRVAMDKQAAAERARREQVLRAEGDKRGAELTSEGVKISLTNESEGMLIKITNESDAAKIKLLREAEGEAEAMRIKATAQAEAIARVAAELEKAGGMDAARLALASEYVDMYGEMGSKSNTMIFNDRPGDVGGLLAQAAAAVGAVPGSSTSADGAAAKLLGQTKSSSQ